MLLQIQISAWLLGTLYVIYVLLVVSSIFVVVSENRNAAKSNAWILALIFLPVLGLILYLLFGRSLRDEKILTDANRDKLLERHENEFDEIETASLSENNRQLINLCNKLGTAHFYPDNDVRMYVKGREKFDDLLNDLQQAQNFIHIQYFIFLDDALGRQVRDALVAAVERGVEVRLLYDDMGCFTVNRRFFHNMKKRGVEVCAFMPIFKFLRPSWRLNYRNHRKIVVIDGKIGYIGGMNIANRYVDGDANLSWRDTHMRIAGSAVRGLQTSFAIDWNYMGGRILLESKYFPESQPMGDKGVQILLSGPMGDWASMAMMCEKVVSMANDYVYIQTPYFLPTDSLVYALQVASLSGVDVRIMIPNRTDWVVMRWGSFSYISQMLSAGIKIYLYQPGMLHAKTIVADDEMASVGSANFDFRSFEHNFETNAIIYGADMALRVKEDFFNDAKHCVLIDNLDEWRRRPFLQKVCESVVRLVSPVL